MVRSTQQRSENQAEPPRGLLTARALGQSSPIPAKIGKYTIIQRIGRGGMGEVFEARDSFLKRPVALKVLSDSLTSDLVAVRRFLLEARAFARVNHPNAVAIYEVDRRDGSSYLAMELMSGGSMQDLLQARGALGWIEATQATIDACRALEATHAACLVHRDVKPANLMRTADGTVKLADFGLAKDADSQKALTAAGGILGTPHYMSPEQCRGEHVDHRSDLYSLGATYYALLAERPPYDSGMAMQVLFAHCSAPVPDPRAIHSEIPEQCAQIIQRAMAKEPIDRYQSAREMLDDLEAALILASPAAASASAIADPSDAAAPVLADLAAALADSRAGHFNPHAASPEPADPATWSPFATHSQLAPGRRSAPTAKAVIFAWGFALVVALSFLIAAIVMRHNSSAPLAAPTIPASVPKPAATKPITPASQTEPSPKLAATRQSPLAMVTKPVRTTAPAPAVAKPKLFFDGRPAPDGWTLDIGEPVESIAISRDGARLAVARSGNNGGTKLWETEHGGSLPAVYTERSVWSVRFSPEKRLLAVGSDIGILLKDPDDAWGRSPSGGSAPGRIRDLAFSRDGSRLAAIVSTDPKDRASQEIRLWDLSNGTELRELSVTRGPMESIAFGVEKTSLIVAGQSGAEVWNVSTPTQPPRQLATGGPIRGMAISQNGELLAMIGPSGIQLWNTKSWTRKGSDLSTGAQALCVAFSSPAGMFLACGCTDGSVKCWTMADAKLNQVIPHAHNGAVTAMAFFPAVKTFVTGGADKTVKIFDLDKRPKSTEGLK